MKAEDRVKFALEFVETNLQREFKRPENEKRFRERFLKFFLPGPMINFRQEEMQANDVLAAYDPVNDSIRGSWGMQEFARLQKQTRSFLAAYLPEPDLGMRISEFQSAPITYGILIIDSRDGKESSHLPTIKGDPYDVFLIMLWFALNGPAMRHIGRCADPKCGKLFFKPTKRAAYCQHNHAVRASMRRMRTRSNGRKPSSKSVGKTVGKLSKKSRETKGKGKIKRYGH